MQLKCALTAVAVMGVAVPAMAAQVVMLPASQDAGIFDNGNASGAGDFFAGRGGNSGGAVRQRALVQFDVDCIPAGAIVTNVQLTLNLKQASSGHPEVDLRLFAVTADWAEGPSVTGGGNGAPAQAGDVTWTHREHPIIEWTAAGGDVVAKPSATLTVDQVFGPKTWPSTMQLVADVQSWVDGGGNFGWLVDGSTQPGSSRRFHSRESADQLAVPVLRIEYELGCAVDVDGSGAVDMRDVMTVLESWGDCPACAADLNCTGTVNMHDLLPILTNWGPCPG